MTCVERVGEAKSFSKPFTASGAYVSTLQALEAAKAVMTSITEGRRDIFLKWMEKSIFRKSEASHSAVRQTNCW